MFTVMFNTRHANLYLIVAVMIVAIVLLTFAVAPSIALRGPGIMPVTGDQNAYDDFLRGEKAMYANSLGVSEALSTYRLGEQAVYASGVDSSSALSTWSFGEKAIAGSASLEAALSAWRQGEKNAK